MLKWLAVLGMVAAAPVAAESLSITGVFAPPAREAFLLRSIAVAPFAGRDGEGVSRAIERRLARPDDDGMRAHFRLVDSAAADATLDGRADVGVDGSDYTETRERCAERADKKCVRRERWEVACTRRTIRLDADVRLVRRRDAAVIYAVPKAREDSDSWCEDGGAPSAIDTVVAGMVGAIAEEVRLDLAPHRETWTTRVREDRGGMTKPIAAAFKDAVHLTKTDPAAACDAFARIDAEAPHPSTAYNVALCAEAAGDYPRARDGYARVAAWVPKKAGDAQKGEARVARLILGQRAMADIRAARGGF